MDLLMVFDKIDNQTDTPKLNAGLWSWCLLKSNNNLVKKIKDWKFFFFFLVVNFKLSSFIANHSLLVLFLFEIGYWYMILFPLINSFIIYFFDLFIKKMFNQIIWFKKYNNNVIFKDLINKVPRFFLNIKK